MHLRYLYHFTTIIHDVINNAYICAVRNTDRAPRSSGRRNNVASWISEIKDTSNVAVRKKRGRRAPPSDDKSSEEVEDVSENLKFLFFYGLLDLNWLHFDWVAFFFLHWIMPLVLNRLNCVTCFKT